MKIKCEKCGKDITMLCDMQIEGYGVGKVKCPSCNTYQKRYISEGDLLLFFGINELLYTLFTYICMLVFNVKVIWVGAVSMLGMCTIYYIIAKLIASYIYLKAPFKKEVMNRTFDEDQKAIKKNLTWQFMIFFVIAVTALTLDSEARSFFLYILPAIPLISFIKLYFQLKYEKRK